MGRTNGIKHEIVLRKKIGDLDWRDYVIVEGAPSQPIDDLTKTVLKPAKKEKIPGRKYFEIMYEYINPELSIAYPQQIPAENRVIGRKYFRSKTKCKSIWDLLNE